MLIHIEDNQPELQRVIVAGEDGIVGTVTHFGAIHVARITRVLGGNIGANALDTQRWTATNTAPGTLTLNAGVGVLNSGGTGGKVVLQTNRRAIFVAGQTARFQSGVGIPDGGIPGVRRRWGMFDEEDGCFFEDNQGVFRIVTRVAGVDETYPHNGFEGDPTLLPYNTIHRYRIEYGTDRVLFRMGERTVHDVRASIATPTWTSNLQVPIRYECETVSGAAAGQLWLRGASYGIMGDLDTTRLGDVGMDISDATPSRVNLGVRVGRTDLGSYALIRSEDPTGNVAHHTAYLTNAGAKEMRTAVGSLGSPVVFSYTVPAGQAWRLHTLNLTMIDSGEAIPTSFGSIGGLVNGLLIEYTTGGNTYTLANLKDNLDLVTEFRASFNQTSNAALLATNDVFIGFREVKPSVVLREGDVVRATVRDDISGLDNLRIAAQLWRSV